MKRGAATWCRLRQKSKHVLIQGLNSRWQHVGFGGWGVVGELIVYKTIHPSPPCDKGKAHSQAALCGATKNNIWFNTIRWMIHRRPPSLFLQRFICRCVNPTKPLTAPWAALIWSCRPENIISSPGLMSDFTGALGCTSPCCYPLTTGVSGYADRGFTACAARGHTDGLCYFEDIFWLWIGLSWIVPDQTKKG